MVIHSEPDWRLCDEWFAEFIAELEQSPVRRRRLRRERVVALPVAETLAQAFQEKTEQLRKYLAGERERWFAEQGKTA
ncbi:hypothetical protein [uncultured Microbacterium sp.]|uniref:hypothetical protein n=1 Tax=Microbacterium algeriense TaxID=2615184 RepID=UPI0025983593|nr:hypothetical protein [uncultured Microbacterium sp.]